MFCVKCGNEIPEGNAFCDKCGNAVSNKPETSESPTTPAPTQATETATEKKADEAKLANNAYDDQPSPSKSTANRSLKKKLAIIAIIAVAAIIAAIAAANVAANMHEAQLQAEEQAAQDAIGEAQVMEFFQQQSELLEPDTKSSWFIGDQQFTLESVDITNKYKNEDSGQLVIEATAHLTSNALARDAKAILVFENYGDGYQLTDESVLEETTLKATKGITYDQKEDAYGRFDVTDMDLKFDAAAQTCSYTKDVSVNEWYGSFTGSRTYSFKFNNGKWERVGSTEDLDIKSLKGLIGSYKDERGSNSTFDSSYKHGYYSEFEIESIDLDNMTFQAYFSWIGAEKTWIGGLAIYAPKASGSIVGDIELSEDGVLSLRFDPDGKAPNALNGPVQIMGNKGELEFENVHVLYTEGGVNQESTTNGESIILKKVSKKK